MSKELSPLYLVIASGAYQAPVFGLTHYSVSAFLQLIAAYGYNDAFQLIFAGINNAGSISWTADLKFDTTSLTLE